VILTEQNKALEDLRQNVERNQNLVNEGGGSLQVKELDWSKDYDEEPCDILLLADCIYYQEVRNNTYLPSGF